MLTNSISMDSLFDPNSPWGLILWPLLVGILILFISKLPKIIKQHKLNKSIPLDIQIINHRGENIFQRYESASSAGDQDKFIVKLHYTISTTKRIDITNINLLYSLDRKPTPCEQKIIINGKEKPLPMAGNYRLKKPLKLRGKLLDIEHCRFFYSTYDYCEDFELIYLEIYFFEYDLNKTNKCTLKGKLEPGGMVSKVTLEFNN